MISCMVNWEGRIIQYWFKILSAQGNKYIKMVYNMMLKGCEDLPNIVNWVSLLRHLLMSLGFYEAWLNQGVGYYNRFILALKRRLTDTFIQNWRARLEDSSRENLYAVF